MTLQRREPRGIVLAPPMVEGEVLPSALSYREYLSLKDAMTRQRDLLLCMTLFATGLRINELLRTSVGRMGRNGPDTFLYIQRSKRKEKRYEQLPLPASLGVLLRAYVDGLGLAQDQPIFGISARHVRRIFAEAGRKAIGRPVHPHELRGARARSLRDAGYPIEVVAQFLGHSDIRTTLKHYLPLTTENKEEIQRRIPV